MEEGQLGLGFWERGRRGRRTRARCAGAACGRRQTGWGRRSSERGREERDRATEAEAARASGAEAGRLSRRGTGTAEARGIGRGGSLAAAAFEALRQLCGEAGFHREVAGVPFYPERPWRPAVSHPMIAVN